MIFTSDFSPLSGWVASASSESLDSCLTLLLAGVSRSPSTNCETAQLKLFGFLRTGVQSTRWWTRAVPTELKFTQTFIGEGGSFSSKTCPFSGPVRDALVNKQQHHISIIIGSNCEPSASYSRPNSVTCPRKGWPVMLFEQWSMFVLIHFIFNASSNVAVRRVSSKESTFQGNISREFVVFRGGISREFPTFQRELRAHLPLIFDPSPP